MHVTVNSDDPSYFGGYVSENLIECQRALDLSLEQILELVRNGFKAAFVSPEEEAAGLVKVEQYARAFDWSQTTAGAPRS